MADWNKIKTKLAQQGKPCNSLVYAKDHKVGTYHIYNVFTGQFMLIRDIIFIHKSYQDYEKGRVLKPHESYDDKNSSLKSIEDKDDEGNEDSDDVYAKMSMLVSDHGSDADKDEVEDPK